MRAAYHLAIAVFSVGAVVTPTAGPNATHQAGPPLSAGQQHASLDATRSNIAEVPMRDASQRDVTLASHLSRGALIGETLPDEIDLHPIPRHETYRYAVMNDHRVIVDAASRRIVYVVR
ncbi:DUF1236 domain-containing protein [Microvirga terrestris]|uniref:DUF1236 domain-containing protein n=1 Tax=Microvirga terrestris TaxID=2791024 RepID=A0ABS0HQX3_9HYPH|nr:DUF1236 domain-containing protein [Microvirga terrestris]MBF9195804.1 DUF1236 domain-containing protein [Microvirga terrestris]